MTNENGKKIGTSTQKTILVCFYNGIFSYCIEQNWALQNTNKKKEHQFHLFYIPLEDFLKFKMFFSQ